MVLRNFRTFHLSPQKAIFQPLRRRRLRSNRGSALLEAAVSFPVLLTVILGMTDLMQVSIAAVRMEHAVVYAGREASIGVGRDANCDGGTDVIKSLLESSAGIAITASDFKLCPVNSVDCSGERGDPLQWMTLTASAEVQSILGKRRIQAGTMFRNMPGAATAVLAGCPPPLS